jgi:hypothetical protein
MKNKIVLEGHNGEVLKELPFAKFVILNTAIEQFTIRELRDKTYVVESSVFNNLNALGSIELRGLQDGVPRNCQNVSAEFTGTTMKFQLWMALADPYNARPFIHFECGLQDHWRMQYSEKLIPDLTKVARLVFR